MSGAASINAGAPASTLPSRIHIIGGPGSGKSTLARRIGARLGVPAFELDSIAEREGLGLNFRPRYALDARLTEVHLIAMAAAWVTEGSYLWWTDELLRAADLIIWLDLPWHVGLRRIVWRHVAGFLRDVSRRRNLLELLRTLRYPHLRSLAAFVRWTGRYYFTRAGSAGIVPADMDDMTTVCRAATAACLAAYSHKLNRYISPAEVDQFLSGLPTSLHRSYPPDQDLMREERNAVPTGASECAHRVL